eukprot:CFRG3957T1
MLVGQHVQFCVKSFKVCMFSFEVGGTLSMNPSTKSPHPQVVYENCRQPIHPQVVYGHLNVEENSRQPLKWCPD